MNISDIKTKILTQLKLIATELELSREATLIEPKNNADLVTNLAMGNKGKDPIATAEQIVEKLTPHFADLKINKIEIAKPGFLNIFLSNDSLNLEVNEILKKGSDYGRLPKTKNLHIEWVSANPTGFLHVGHARNAVIGSAVNNICEFAGFNVKREYYVNDAGNQINILAESLFARYQQKFDKSFPMPEDSYRGEDILWAAGVIYDEVGDKYKNLTLEGEVLEYFKIRGVKLFLDQVKVDLKKLGIEIETYYSEKSLYENDRKIIYDTLDKLENTYKKDGAVWLKTTVHGDDKDRVLIKSDNSLTYFAPDVAYHNIKFLTNPKDTIILNVWGADHLSYIKRMKCAMEDLGHNPDNLVVLCMQLVRLVKGGQEYKMSKRKGTSFFLREFIDLVGVDSVRFFLLDRNYNSKIDFDIDLANNKSNDNPVILIQYANARAYSLLEKAGVLNKDLVATELDEKHSSLVATLSEFPQIIKKSSEKFVTSLLTQYAIKLAKEFNSWYTNSEKIIGSAKENSSLALVKASNIILENCLRLLGISIPHKM
ncbi:arginine--tRNA ligase [Mycoplasmopsis opalescens]|uniref:arginine--tRNA ligase n=1 Tax=Mycoplasmopsis opalescens TaxID=114886 RepID=UPI0004A6E284|nr:arginine--tRNA ligase [Mycoplasmopsis opalescens]